MLAARSAQLLNLADLGRDLGLALNTVKAWLSVLEASHQVIILRPYFANVGKRLVKTPRVYFTDTGGALLPDRAEGPGACGVGTAGGRHRRNRRGDRSREGVLASRAGTAAVVLAHRHRRGG